MNKQILSNVRKRRAEPGRTGPVYDETPPKRKKPRSFLRGFYFSLL